MARVSRTKTNGVVRGVSRALLQTGGKVENKNLLRLWIAATRKMIDHIDLCISVASRRGNEDAGQRLGVFRAKCQMDLACLLAARQSTAGETAQVRYFPDHKTIVLVVGEDTTMSVEAVPEVLGALLARYASNVLARLGYQLRKNLVVQQTYHPDRFVVPGRHVERPN